MVYIRAYRAIRVAKSRTIAQIAARYMVSPETVRRRINAVQAFLQRAGLPEDSRIEDIRDAWMREYDEAAKPARVGGRLGR